MFLQLQHAIGNGVLMKMSTVSIFFVFAVIALISGCGKSGSDAVATGDLAPRYLYPDGMTTDGTNLYITNADNNLILKVVISTNAVTTIAGSGTWGHADGTGTSASFNSPHGITTDGTNLYVADSGNNEIRKIVISTGVVTTFAGSITWGNADGIGSAAAFNCPNGITTDGTNLYVADTDNTEIRKIVIATGEVSTLAGSKNIGNADGTGSSAAFCFPNAITADADGTNLYVADSGNKEIRRIVISTGVVTTMAAGWFAWPSSLTVSADGLSLFVADSDQGEIKKVLIASGMVSSFADITASGVVADGTNLYLTDLNGYIRKIEISTGTVTDVIFKYRYPYEITSDGTSLYIADSGNNRIRKVVIATGESSVVAGSSVSGYADGTGTAAQFSDPQGLAVDGTNLYVVDADNNEIRKIALSTGVVTTLAGSTIPGSLDGTVTNARFNSPTEIAIHGSDLYVTDSSNNEIRKIELSTGAVTTFAGSITSGDSDGTGIGARFNNPVGIVIDPAGENFYVTDTKNNEIRKIVISTGVVTTFAGSVNSDNRDGIGTNARFNSPYGIAIDAAGTSLYISDMRNNEIRKIDIATASVTTLAGSSVPGSADGIGSAARFYYPWGIVVVGNSLYVADVENSLIRRIVISTGEVSTLSSY